LAHRHITRHPPRTVHLNAGASRFSHPITSNCLYSSTSQYYQPIISCLYAGARSSHTIAGQPKVRRLFTNTQTPISAHINQHKAAKSPNTLNEVPSSVLCAEAGQLPSAETALLADNEANNSTISSSSYNDGDTQNTLQVVPVSDDSAAIKGAGHS